MSDLVPILVLEQCQLNETLTVNREMLNVLANEGHSFLAEDDRMIVGSIKIERSKEDVLEVSSLCVDSQYRKKGIGTLLLRLAIESVSQMNKSTTELGLWVSADNREAISLYLKEGFVYAYSTNDKYFDGSSVVRMICKVQPS